VKRKLKTATQLKNCKRDLKTHFTIEGYFALYEQETELFEGVYEIITKGAFNKTLNNDIRALWNHNTQYVLGRNKSGSLELREDDKGLFGVVKLPATQYAKDLYELISRGDVDQCSFGFNILDEELEELASGAYRFRLKEVDLHEISVVTFPAYENTTVQARTKQLEQMQQRKLETKKLELQKRLEGINKC
jgi:HK97 family phage prohead protease